MRLNPVALMLVPLGQLIRLIHISPAPQGEAIGLRLPKSFETSEVWLVENVSTRYLAEHPAWEDLIVAENLHTRLGELDDYLRRL